MYTTTWRHLRNILLSLKKRGGRNRTRFIAQSHLCKLETYTHTKSQSIKIYLRSYVSSALKWVSVKGRDGIGIGYEAGGKTLGGLSWANCDSIL